MADIECRSILERWGTLSEIKNINNRAKMAKII